VVKKTPASDTILAFVADDASEAIIKEIPVRDYGLSLISFRGNAKAAYEYLKANHSPRILIVDITGSDLPISDVAALAEVCEPGVDVIVIGDNNDIGIFRGLLTLGVKDYIVKPVSTNFLVRSVENIVYGTQKGEKHQGFSRLGSVITFIGARGGVGTSTLAANCAWVLSEQFHKLVYLLDMHLQCGVISYFFDLPPTPGLKELLSHPERVDKNMIDKSFERYSERLVIASTQENLSEASDVNAESLNKMMSIVSNQAHYTIIDLPRNFDSPTTAAILADSNVVIVVVDFTIFSVRDAARIISYVKETNSKDHKILVIANRVGEYNKGEIEKKVFEEAIQRQVDLVVSFDQSNILDAINSGTPIAKGNHPISKEITQMAGFFVGAKSTQEEGFFSKFMHSINPKG
jgi:pilus assembly protein CpaE